MNSTKALEWADHHLDTSIGLVKELVSYHSSNDNPEAVLACAERVRSLLGSLKGCKAEIYETPGNPVIVAHIPSAVPNAPTVLLYGHYDVVPGGDAGKWRIPDPFDVQLIDGRLYGRGVADNKAQMLAHVCAVNAMQETGTPINANVKFIIEGEEEGGNKNLSSFVASHRDLLAADFVYTSDGCMHESGAPIVSFGGRGCIMTRLRLKTSEYNHHSGRRGGVVPNAGQRMVDLFSSFFDTEGNVTLEGFYDGIKPPSEFDLELIDALPYDKEMLAKSFGVKSLPYTKREYYINTMFRPTFELNYFNSGMLGSIPGSAEAGLDMRMVAGQDPDKIFETFKKHVAAFDPEVEILPVGVGYPSRTQTDLPICKKVVSIVREAYGREPVCIPIVGFTCPDYVWTKVLGVPSITVPYANTDSNNHSPNENIAVDCFRNGIRATIQLLDSINK